MSEKWKLIGRGTAGWHAQNDRTSSSGGDLEDYSYGGVPVLGYRSRAEEGALVYDASATGVDRSAFRKLVISGPMVDPSLPCGTVDRFGARRRLTTAKMNERMDAAWQALLENQSNDLFGSLDTVSLDIFEALLRKVPGIRMGRVQNGAVVWEGA